MADDYWGPDLPEYDVQASLREQKKQCLLRARRVFYTAKNYFRTSAPELREERAMLLEEWLNLESSFGKLGDVNMVRVKLPKKLKKRRLIETEDGPVGNGVQVSLHTPRIVKLDQAGASLPCLRPFRFLCRDMLLLHYELSSWKKFAETTLLSWSLAERV
ncbi:hypothetical protein LguiB_018111 [Lonicera macranthoides]